MPRVVHPFRLTDLMEEKDLQNWLRDTAGRLGWKYYHPWNSQKSTEGYPDTTLIKGERLIMAELKIKKKVPIDAQQGWLDAFAKVRRVETYCWYPRDIDDILTILQRY